MLCEAYYRTAFIFLLPAFSANWCKVPRISLFC